jgi:prepilin-type N-terminal cleavage/methylation domain-containing protein
MRTFQKKLRRKQAGFSLIELLVVIAIIGFLATATLIALSNARKKSRDSTRKHVAAQVRKALELYYNSNQGYPNASSAVAFNDAGLIAALAPFVSLANDPSCGSIGPREALRAGCTAFRRSVPRRRVRFGLTRAAKGPQDALRPRTEVAKRSGQPIARSLG